MTQSLNSSLPVDTPAYGRALLPLYSATCHSTADTRHSSSSSLLHPEIKDLPQLLQAKLSSISLNKLVVQAKPVSLDFNSSKTCSIQSFHNSLTTSARGVMFYL